MCSLLLYSPTRDQIDRASRARRAALTAVKSRGRSFISASRNNRRRQHRVLLFHYCNCQTPAAAAAVTSHVTNISPRPLPLPTPLGSLSLLLAWINFIFVQRTSRDCKLRLAGVDAISITFVLEVTMHGPCSTYGPCSDRE